jgi:peptidoglycan/xylan/chitin deacetylase (PgdA/CDA1 family)
MRLGQHLLAALAVTALLLPGWLQAQTLSFTFDDGLDPRTQARASEWNGQLLAALAAENVKAMLFPAGKIVGSAEGMKLVADWSARGHAIGNHSYSHQGLGSKKMSLENFTADVMLADEMFRSLPGWVPRLRFPYLQEGDTPAKRDGIRDWMAAKGYEPAPVSIVTSDWYYDDRFLKWRSTHADDDSTLFRKAYLAHLLDRANYYEHLARELLGRSPVHVMLLHTNALNAAFLPAVIAMFKSKGWKIVSPAEAFRDPLYAEKPSTLPAGESIVWSLAKQAQRIGLRYPAEDSVYEQTTLDALGL